MSRSIPVLTIPSGHPWAFAQKEIPASGHLTVNFPHPSGHLTIQGAFACKLTENVDLVVAPLRAFAKRFCAAPRPLCKGFFDPQGMVRIRIERDITGGRISLKQKTKVNQRLENVIKSCG